MKTIIEGKTGDKKKTISEWKNKQKKTIMEGETADKRKTIIEGKIADKQARGKLIYK